MKRLAFVLLFAGCAHVQKSAPSVDTSRVRGAQSGLDSSVKSARSQADVLAVGLSEARDNARRIDSKTVWLLEHTP